MGNWIEFKGVRSDTLGVEVLQYPDIPLAEERKEHVPIPGRSGTLTQTEGENVFEDVLLPVKSMVHNLDALDQIAVWLRGMGNLVLGNLPGRYYDAQIVNQIDLAKILRGPQHRAFTAVFRCKPFRYVNPVPTPLTYASMTNKVTNDSFDTDTTGWTATNASFSVASGAGVMRASAANGFVGSAVGGTTIGNKYYVSALVKASSALVRISLGTATAFHSAVNQYERLSLIFTATGTGHTVSLTDTRASGWNDVIIDDVLCVDMTAYFGAGNEPATLADMDAYMAARFAASFMSGTDAYGQTINPGTASAQPLITVVGSGDIDLSFIGKNRAKPGSVITTDGVTVAFLPDGSVRVTGTCTATVGSPRIFVFPIGYSMRGTISMSMGNEVAYGSDLQMRLMQDASNSVAAVTTNFSASAAYASLTFDLHDQTVYGWALRVQGGKTYNAILRPQIEVASAPTTFEPYKEQTIHIASLATAITIDCETGMAYNGAADLTGTVTLTDDFAISAGVGRVSGTGTVTSLTMTRPWRYI